MDSGKRLFGSVTVGKTPLGPKAIRVLRAFDPVAAEVPRRERLRHSGPDAVVSNSAQIFSRSS